MKQRSASLPFCLGVFLLGSSLNVVARDLAFEKSVKAQRRAPGE
jgi:hypothetical protein